MTPTERLAMIQTRSSALSNAMARARIGDVTPAAVTEEPKIGAAAYAIAALSTVSMVASAYHGVKRNRGSVGYGILWGVAGALFPIITPGIALAQGYAKPVGR